MLSTGELVSPIQYRRNRMARQVRVLAGYLTTMRRYPMSEESKVHELTTITQPMVELPVEDVERAQQHYRDTLGFSITWLLPEKSMGAVARGEAGMFFRKTEPPITSVTLWIFTPQLHATYEEFQRLGANIVEPLEKKPWGLTQFTVADSDGHRLTFHHDL
jgi:predicted enzyme related to lactoylglutathione lyase